MHKDTDADNVGAAVSPERGRDGKETVDNAGAGGGPPSVVSSVRPDALLVMVSVTIGLANLGGMARVQHHNVVNDTVPVEIVAAPIDAAFF